MIRLIFITIASFLCTILPAQNQQTAPNVLMICIDDLNDWVGCLTNSPNTHTPHMDALASRGRLFTNAHCAVTVCSPSRISIMSGLAPTTHGSYKLGPAYEGIEALNKAPTLHRWFKDNGYKTITGGKVLHHGFNGRLAGDIDVNLDKQLRIGYFGSPRPGKVLSWKKGAWDWGSFPAKDDEMLDYKRSKAAAEELRKTHAKPFFMSVGIYRPHVPLYVPQKWFDLIDPDKITLPKAPASDMDDIPKNFQRKMGIAPTFATIKAKQKWRSLVHAYLASIAFADHCVGELIKGLQEGPNKDNTIVLLWSDHGFHLGEKQHIAKRTLWEESTRVPLIITGPGIKPGNCPEPASLIDVYPTLTELCGLPSNTTNNGVSLMPQINNPAQERQTPAITSSFFGNHAIRSRDWRYIRYANGAEELYHHQNDQDEFTNLASKPEYNEIKQKLSRWIPQNAAPEVTISKRNKKAKK